MKFILFALTLAFSLNTFAGPGCPGLEKSPFYGKVGIYQLWKANVSGQSGDYSLSIGFSRINYISKRSQVTLRLILKDPNLQIPFNNEQEIIINSDRVGACSSSHTGVSVRAQISAGSYRLEALDGNGKPTSSLDLILE